MPKNNIIQFKRQKLFKNARLVDIENASVEKVDILVDGERIARIAPKIGYAGFCEYVLQQ